MSTSVPTERPPSVWEDLLEIFYAPTAVFQRRRETPAFGLALLIFVLVGVGLFFAFKGVMEPMMDADIRRSLEHSMKTNPQIKPEMLPQFIEAGRKWAIVGVLGFSIIVPLLVGLCTWVVGKVVESKAELGQMMMVATYSYYPRLIEGIVNAVQLLVLPEESIKSRYSVSLGAGRFLDVDQANPILLALLGRLDVFTIWVTVLLGIGLSVMGQIPRGRAMFAAALMWVVGAIIPVLGAAFQ